MVCLSVTGTDKLLHLVLILPADDWLMGILHKDVRILGHGHVLFGLIVGNLSFVVLHVAPHNPVFENGMYRLIKPLGFAALNTAGETGVPLPVLVCTGVRISSWASALAISLTL